MNDEDKDAIRLLLDEEDWGIWRKCPLKECDKQFPNFSALLAHLRRDHGWN